MRGFGILADGGRPTRVVDTDVIDGWFREAIARPFTPSEARLARIEGTVSAAFRTRRPTRDADLRRRSMARRPHVGARIWLAVAALLVFTLVVVTQAGTGLGGAVGPSQPGLHDAVDRTRLPATRPTAPVRDHDRETGGGVGVSSGHVPAPHDAGRSARCRPGVATQRTPIGDPLR